MAQKYFADHSFFQLGDSYLALLQSPWSLPVFWGMILAAVAGSICVAYRRKQGSPADGEEE